MSVRISGENGVVCRIPDSPFGYFGWSSIALKADGTLWKWNAGYSDPVQVTDISR